MHTINRHMALFDGPTATARSYKQLFWCKTLELTLNMLVSAMGGFWGFMHFMSEVILIVSQFVTLRRR